MEDSRIDRITRFSKIWWQSRADAEKSQEFMALGLGVSKKTVQNWEKGISAPDLFQGSEWFRILGLNPLPYYLAFLFPELFGDISPTPPTRRWIWPCIISLTRPHPWKSGSCCF